MADLVEAAQRVKQVLLRDIGCRFGVRSGQDASIHRNQVRCKHDLNRLPGSRSEDLIDFWRVAVTPHIVSRRAFVALGIMRHQLRCAACSTHSAF